MMPKILQVNPEEVDEETLLKESYCLKCGHWIDIRLYDKREVTRYFHEHICKFCQREVKDPNPERTEEILTATPWSDYKRRKRVKKLNDFVKSMDQPLKIEIITVESYFYTWYIDGIKKIFDEDKDHLKYIIDGNIEEKIAKNRVEDFYIEGGLKWRL